MQLFNPHLSLSPFNWYNNAMQLSLKEAKILQHSDLTTSINTSNTTANTSLIKRLHLATAEHHLAVYAQGGVHLQVQEAGAFAHHPAHTLKGGLSCAAQRRKLYLGQLGSALIQKGRYLQAAAGSSIYQGGAHTGSGRQLCWQCAWRSWAEVMVSDEE